MDRDATTSPSFRVRARGPLACFVRPTLGKERVSYEVMNPASARVLLECVLWKPALRWQIESIAALSPIVWVTLHTRENGRITARRDVFADEDHENDIKALRDVDYLIQARMHVRLDRAGPGDDVRRFGDIFERRLHLKQYFHAPYLGCREFPGEVLPGDEAPPPIEPGLERSLGAMFYDFDYSPGLMRPVFFDARLTSGVLHVPPFESVLASPAVAPAAEAEKPG
ncbi:MAG TPA: type I-C CRISPR-associated protein Cas5c [Polyangia bacterium]|jgi:CRISPR-associated protein Cas5d|nr:type I-C CRISPR-associated protein Cas5c [Polyangia bacterium]